MAIAPVQRAVGRLKRVTVGTQHAKVLEPVVLLVTIHVIELDGDAAVTATHFCPSAHLARWPLEAFAERPFLQCMTPGPSTLDEKVRERNACPRRDRRVLPPALPGEMPRIDAELADAPLHVAIVTSGWHELEPAEHLCDAARARDGRSQLFVAPVRAATAPAAAACEVRDIERQRAIPPAYALLHAAVAAKEQARKHISEGARSGDGAAQVGICPRLRARRSGAGGMARIEGELFDPALHVVVIATTAAQSEVVLHRRASARAAWRVTAATSVGHSGAGRSWPMPATGSQVA